ncbi:MAG: hypothetical protein AAFQ66_16020 [Pseudomonadota bacterium]
MATDTIRYATLSSRNVRCQLRVNDIPVIEHPGDLMVNSAEPIRQYVRAGDNAVSLICWPREEDGGFAEGAYAAARVADYREGETLSPERGIEYARLTAALSPDATAPEQLTTSFSSPDGGNWAWNAAPLLDLETARGPLNAMLTHVANRFAARDMDSLVALFEPAIRDKATAYAPLSIDGLVNMTRAWLSTTDPETWATVPFDPAQIEYRPAAHGRLVQPLGPDGLPAIRSEWIPPPRPEDRPFYVALPGLIGLHQGQLRFMT